MTPKLHTLTPEQKTRLLVELRNAFFETDNGSTCKKCGHYLLQHIDQRWCNDFDMDSYDAIIPLVQKLPQDIKNKVGEILFMKHGHPFAFFDFTPSQLGDAVLVATGRATA